MNSNDINQVNSKITQDMLKSNNNPVKYKSILLLIVVFLTVFLLFSLFLNLVIKVNNNNNNIDNIKIDIVYKYIDIRDKELKREGIKQLKKDEDNEELRYSIRSILMNIPWINMIYIIMPNKRVRFLKDDEEREKKIKYINDKELLGFDSSSSITFEHNALYKLDKYNVSEYYIYMNDDCFINKKLKKKDFYYYSKKERRIVPYVMNYKAELSNKVYKKYNNYYIKNKNKLNKECKQTYKDYWFQTCLSYLLLYKHFNTTSILLPSSFDYNWHNALPLTLSDLKEIKTMEEEEYEYKEDLFNSKYRTNKQITFESVYSYYFYNKYKRKRGKLKGKNANIKSVEKEIMKNYDVFCINTGPERISYKNKIKEKDIMKRLFPNTYCFEL